MEFLTNITSFGGSAFGYIIPFVFVLSIVVFFHELGHFLVGRWCGVKVLVFSIGFGPELFAFHDRQGTRWRIAAVPLGGYVKFFGDANAASMPDADKAQLMSEEERKVSFFHKAIWQRSLIVAAGPIANFILAIVIFAGIFSIVGKQVVAPRIDTVNAGSAAERAGLQPGDVILSIDGAAITSFSAMQRVVSASPGRELSIEVMRDGETVKLAATPEMKEQSDGFGGTMRIGLLGVTRSTNPSDVSFQRADPLTAIGMGVSETTYIVTRTFDFIGGLFAGREHANQIGGPIRIAQMSEHVAESGGLIGLVSLAAVLSVSIGLLNLFPIPLLDGGHLVFYAIEAIRGRPLAERAQELLFKAGLAAVLMLMVFATWNDLVHVLGG
ncbi:MAG: RIP metalloprotease RseP [Labrys sp. (in: a-proteobacteria)]|jgi:regulator of sigma E protease